MSEHPVHDALRAYAERLEAETSPGTVHRAVRRALGAPPGRMRLRRVAVLLASALGFRLGNAALALAVHPSVPGDAPYGVDQAYERVAALVGVRLGSPEERAVTRDEHRIVAEAFAALRLRDRQILWLREVQVLTDEEVGVALGIRPGAVRVAAMRARRRLEEA